MRQHDSATAETEAEGAPRAPLSPLFVACGAFLVAACLGGAVIWFAEDASIAAKRQSAAVTAATQASRIKEQLERSMSATYSLAALVRQGNGKLPEFDEIAREMLPQFPGVSALQLAPGGVIRHIVPLAGHEKALGHDLFADSKRNKEALLARQTRRLTLAGPFQLIQGGTAVIGRLPVFLDDAMGTARNFWGFATAVVMVDDLVAASSISDLLLAGYRFELSRLHPDTGVRQMFSGTTGVPLQSPLEVEIVVPNGRWTLGIEPQRGWWSGRTLGVELLLALLGALTVAVAAYQAAGVPARLAMLVARRTRDIEAARRNLERSEARFRDLSETTSDWIWEVDAGGAYSYASPKVRDLLGYEPVELIGCKPIEFMPPAEAIRVGALFRAIVDKRRTFELLENVNLHKNGREVVLETSGIPLLSPDGKLLGYRGIHRDVSGRRQLESALEQYAYYDPLSGLPNRKLFRDRLGQAAAVVARGGRSMALLMLDIDRLKNVNDGLGHDAGDELIRAVAERLRGQLRDEDSVGRLEGDEFAALIMGVDGAGDAARIADKLREALMAPYQVHGRDLHATVSIGISLYPDDAADLDMLERHADTALHRAKKTGDCFRFFKPKMNDDVSRFLMLENKMRLALERSQFVLHYQPQLDLRTGRIGAAEALIRWRDPEAGLVAPEQFIPLAEETGLIVPIGDWVLQESCRQAMAWRAAGTPCRVAVNLSPLQFRNNHVLDSLAQAFATTGAAPEMLELEITEGVVMRRTDDALDTLRKFAAMGFRIAVDDFGSGYSSLAYLKHMPVHVLKIDGSFVRDMVASAHDRAIVSAVITLGHALGMTVLAEGVETRQQLELLKEMRCDAIQGYLYSAPLAAEEFSAVLRGGGLPDLAGVQQAGSPSSREPA